MSSADKRAALLKARRAEQVEQQRVAPTAASPDAARAHFTGASAIEALTAGRVVQALPVIDVAPELRPELRQPRLLPLPEELQSDGAWDEAERPLIDELLALGESLREGQIQPIVVYAGTSARYPRARYLILVGHRRWTAARLVGLATIDAIVVDPPAPATLIAIQFSENEERAEFCDMERAWALERMRQLLPDAPWETIEGRFRLSESRRKQLMRLTAFTPEQQRAAARLRASEFQLRPLHTALREGHLTPPQADRIFAQLAAQPKVTPPSLNGEQEGTADTRAITTIDQSTIARLVARARRRAAPEPSTRPRWLPPLQHSLQQASANLERASPRIGDLDEAALNALQQDVDALLIALETMVATLATREQGLEEDGME